MKLFKASRGFPLQLKAVGACALMVVLVVLSGCLAVVDQLNDIVGESMGTYTAPTLAASPQSSGCSTSRCAELDQLEADLYSYARNGQITWLKLVDHFYSHRAKLYPGSFDSGGVSELYAYQRMLAEQMDNRQITESQWRYLIEQKKCRNKSKKPTERSE